MSPSRNSEKLPITEYEPQEPQMTEFEGLDAARQVSATSNEGKWLEAWNNADEHLRRMFGITELPDQRVTAQELRNYEARLSKGDISAKEEFMMRRLRFMMQIALRANEEQDSMTGLTLEDHFQNTFIAFSDIIDGYIQKNQAATKPGDLRAYIVQHRSLNSGNLTSKKAQATGVLIRLPADKREHGAKINRCIEKYREEYNVSPEITYISESTGIDPDEIKDILAIPQVVEQFPHLDSIKDIRGVGTADVIEEVERQLVKEDIRDILSEHLEFRERRILELRYGLNGEQPRTLTATGAAFDIGMERVRQIENEALKKLGNLREAKERLHPVLSDFDTHEGLRALPPTPLQLQRAQDTLHALKHQPWKDFDTYRRIDILEEYLEKYKRVEVEPTKPEKEQ